MDLSTAAQIENLKTAFPPHPLDPTLAFDEWGPTYLDAARFRTGTAGRSWPDLPAAFLEWAHDALVFFGPSSIGEYLPAYLASLLRRDGELSAMPGFLLYGVLTRRDAERFDARFAQLTGVQRKAVAAALLAYERDVAGTPRQTDVTEALDSYWRSLIAERD